MGTNPKQNMKNLFTNSRTRTIIIITGVILVLGLVIGVVRLFRAGTPGADTATELSAPPQLSSVPGGEQPSEDYQRLVAQANEQQAQLAAERGGSAIPTIIDTSQFDQTQKPQRQDCCCSPVANCPSTGNGKVPPLQSTSLTSGTLVYDNTGHVIGNVGADGKVRDNNGQVIGVVGPDGVVHDQNGVVIGSTGRVAVDSSVYDSAGNLIGTVGTDGRVRDAQNNILGTVDPDGTVRDMKGAVIGKASSPASNTPIYDAQGNLIGTADVNGQVHDASGKIIGVVGGDGIVRNASGNVIGKVGTASLAGTLTYDKAGNLVGTVDENGQVRDASGKVIGVLGADGNVRDAQGNIVAKTGVAAVGTPVYDDSGKLLGMVGADGQVRNANGDVVGTVGADGTVHDSSGNIIGKVATNTKAGCVNAVPGAPVYDKQGRLIGTVGPDRRVRDIHGQVIGTVANDCSVRDRNNHVIGKIGPTAPGAPVYDKQGRMIGTVGADGIVRDAQGRAIGQLAEDGTVRDPQGDAIGSTTPPPPTTSAVLPTRTPAGGTIDSANSELQAIMQQQAEQISAQKAEQMQQQLQAAMATQAGQLFTAWTTVSGQQYVEGIPPIAQRTSGSGSGGGAGAGDESTRGVKPAVKAGTVMYATLLSEVNSDAPGPVLAEIVSGKFKGGRVIGTLTNQGQSLLLSFSTLTLPNYDSSIPINTVAIDQKTAQTAVSSYTDNHYLLRYGTFFASTFLQGYAQALLQSGQTIVTNGLAINQSNPDLSPKGKFFVALGNVGSQFSSLMSGVFSTPPTVYVYSGTPIGLLFLNDLVMPSSD